MHHRFNALRIVSAAVLLGACTASAGALGSPAHAVDPPSPEAAARDTVGFMTRPSAPRVTPTPTPRPDSIDIVGSATSGALQSRPRPRGIGARTLPSCVYVSAWSSGAYRYAQATNSCTTAQWVKIYWSFAPDTACTLVPANGGWLRSRRAAPATFDGASSCV